MMQILSLSLLLPIAYLSILIGSLATFSHLYRRRQLHAKLRLAPYFPTHNTRNVYLSLLHLPDHAPSSTDEKGKVRKVTVPDSVLRAALLTRACTDIERILEIRTRKPALNQLLQRGVVGDEIWQRLLRAEQELEMEVKDVVSEANALSPGWGAVIFQSAGEMIQNRNLRQKLDKVKEGTAAAKEQWEKTKELARKELLGEEAEKQPQTQTQQQQRQPSKATPTTAAVNGDADESKSKASTTVPKPAAVSATVADGSDDDEAVLVEREGAEGSSSQPTSPCASSKKKNKKKNKANKQQQQQQQQQQSQE